ncbi:sucrose-6F-phosphate phosphohydrolase-domain-containing protein [Haematococcus lacustris]
MTSLVLQGSNSFLTSRPQCHVLVSFRPRACRPGRSSRRGPLAVSAILLSPERSKASGSVSQDESTSSQLQQSPLVPTHFCWNGGGSGVEIWGSWNNWERPVKMHCPGEGLPHRAIIPMPLGGVEFKYKVDGAWRISLKEETVNSNEGHLNNFRVVQPTLDFAIDAPGVQSASVVGDWDNWQYSMPLERDMHTGSWVGSTHLRPGQYCYQYILDQRAAHNEEEEAGVYPGRGVVNMAWAVEQSLFRIFYCTGWEDVVLHHRRVTPTGDTQPWQQLRMVSASSRGNALGRWFMGVVVPEGEGEMLDFFLTNGKTGSELKEDRPTASKASMGSVRPGSSGRGDGGLVYTLPVAASFKLSWGAIRPFPRGAEPRYMLVSDIDGTMIGEHGDPSQYASSRRFREYWENGPALAGSLLVYNTGRSMGQVREMLKNVPDVATPDAMIVAVGTKVFLNMDEVGRARTNGQNWVEDQEWTRQLDVGWNLAVVRKHGRKLMEQYADSGRLSVLDDGSEHQHRFSLSADISIAEHVMRTLVDNCKREGLEVRVIASGVGSHRYVDCVPMAAGKEKALQFLRAKYDIPEHFVCAAGDSGNDILMLEGDHPAIVVGNAQTELISWMVRQPQTGKVLLAEAFYADGIMEGLARHGLF